MQDFPFASYEDAITKLMGYDCYDNLIMFATPRSCNHTCTSLMIEMLLKEPILLNPIFWCIISTILSGRSFKGWQTINNIFYECYCYMDV